MIKIILISILILMVLLCIVMLILTRSEIKRITANLKQISKENTNQKIKLSYSNHSLEEMVVEMNRFIERKKVSEIEFRYRDMQQRQEIANISHDLRTPLTSVIGYIQLLQDEGLPLEQKKRYQDIVLIRAMSLQTLITDFFELSRCEAGEYSFNIEPIRLQDILCELLAAYYNDFIDRGIEPVIEVDESLPAIPADESAIRRIYQNLMHNAIKHGNGCVNISLTRQGAQLVSSFTNDAPQLSKEDIEHIFDRTYTADKMRSKGNTGLGLSIVKALVEQLKGKISTELSDGRLSIIICWNII